MHPKILNSNSRKILDYQFIAGLLFNTTWPDYANREETSWCNETAAQRLSFIRGYGPIYKGRAWFAAWMHRGRGGRRMERGVAHDGNAWRQSFFPRIRRCVCYSLVPRFVFCSLCSVKLLHSFLEILLSFLESYLAKIICKVNLYTLNLHIRNRKD